MNIFEQATRNKLRFSSSKGILTVEDLWELPLTSANSTANLDDIARGFYADLKDTSTISFVNKPAKADPETELSFNIVKHIIEVRLAENAAAAVARENKERKQRLLGIIEHKENEVLTSKSLDELRAIANSL